MRQLLLSLKLREDATFSNFYSAKNKALVEYLQHPNEKLIYLTGKRHTGLTHLLQALCHIQANCLYIPLKNRQAFSPEILHNSAQLNLVAVDDIDTLSAEREWEEALFEVFNQMTLSQNLLVISGHIPPSQLTLKLPDLKSRLQSMLCLTIEPLTDEEKIAVLQQRAHQRGFELPAQVSHFLLTHAPRDLSELIRLFEKLDKISLEEKRRLTIPLVKKALFK
jgi:DnaA family protein